MESGRPRGSEKSNAALERRPAERFERRRALARYHVRHGPRSVRVAGNSGARFVGRPVALHGNPSQIKRHARQSRWAGLQGRGGDCGRDRLRYCAKRNADCSAHRPRGSGRNPEKGEVGGIAGAYGSVETLRAGSQVATQRDRQRKYTVVLRMRVLRHGHYFRLARESGVVRDPAPTSPSKALSIRYEFSGFVQRPRLSGLTNLIAKADTHPFCPCLPNQLTPYGVEELLGPFHGRKLRLHSAAFICVKHPATSQHGE